MQRPEAFAELDRAWHCYANGDVMCDGPVAVLHHILRWMGWHWRAPANFAREGRCLRSLVLQGMRLEEWSRAGSRRGDMSGIESTAGIGKKATIKASSSTKIPSEQQPSRSSLMLRLDTEATV